MSLHVDVVGDNYAIVDGHMLPVVYSVHEDGEWFLHLISENGVMMMVAIPDDGQADDDKYPSIGAMAWQGDPNLSLDYGLRISNDAPVFVPEVTGPGSSGEHKALSENDRLILMIFGDGKSKTAYKRLEDVADMMTTIARWSVMPVVVGDCS